MNEGQLALATEDAATVCPHPPPPCSWVLILESTWDNLQFFSANERLSPGDLHRISGLSVVTLYKYLVFLSLSGVLNKIWTKREASTLKIRVISAFIHPWSSSFSWKFSIIPLHEPKQKPSEHFCLEYQQNTKTLFKQHVILLYIIVFDSKTQTISRLFGAQ